MYVDPFGGAFYLLLALLVENLDPKPLFAILEAAGGIGLLELTAIQSDLGALGDHHGSFAGLESDGEKLGLEIDVGNGAYQRMHAREPGNLPMRV